MTADARKDVIVVGGGPAGASVAAWLARAGLEVVLLDRARFPRDKACGEFLTPAACRLLSDMGAWEAVLAAGARPVARIALIAPDGAQAEHIPGDAGYALRRSDLDRVLLEQARLAGAAVREGFAVRTLLWNAQGHVVGVTGQAEGNGPEEIRARLVIGADGTHSRVARQLGLVRAVPRLQRIALVSHWRGIFGDAIEMRARGRTVCGLGFPGPQPGNANLTLVVPTSAAARMAGRASDFLEETLQTQFPDMAARLAGAEREPDLRAIGCFGHVCRPAVAGGALLVGDAATFIDPFTGEGIYFALFGAQMAAEVAVEALRANDTSRARLMAYEQARRELAHRYLLCDIVQAIVRMPALYTQAARRLDRLPDLAGRLFAVLGDLRPPGDVLNLDFLWRLATG